jgi:serine/threonine protein kinase
MNVCPLLCVYMPALVCGTKMSLNDEVISAFPRCVESARCLAEVWSAAALKPGDVVLGKYRLSKRTGDDGNVMTFLANETASNAVVTVKELRLGTVKGNRQIEIFEREAATRRSLDHPGIPKHVDIGFEGGRMLLVYEMTDGPSLAELVRGGVRFDEVEVEAIARELLVILKYLGTRRFSSSLYLSQCPSSVALRWHRYEVDKTLYDTCMHHNTAVHAQCERFHSCRPPLMDTNLKPENVYLDPLGRSVHLVDVGFVQQDASVSDNDNPDGAPVTGTAGFLHRMVPFPKLFECMQFYTVYRILCFS